MKKYKNIIKMAIILLLIIFIYFFVDLGINSKRFIKRDIDKAFLYIQTNQCDKFLKYVNYSTSNSVDNEYKEEMIKFCNNLNIWKFTSYKITAIDHDIFSNTATIQINTLKTGRSDARTLKLKRTWNGWKINNSN